MLNPSSGLLAQAVHEFARQSGRKIYLIAESDLNDVRYIQPAESGGYGLDAQWSDDFHHAVHTLLTGETIRLLPGFWRARCIWEKPSKKASCIPVSFPLIGAGAMAILLVEIPARQFVVFAQNHDQVGNRMFGDRLSTLVSFEASKLAAGMVILSPYIPLLFMGEEWGEPAPFQYFTSHSDAVL